MGKSEDVGYRGLVFDIQRFSLHDGPGIRTLVFLKGCPLRCLWCDNPESQNTEPEIAESPIRCIRCGNCFHVCPTGAISPDRWFIDRQKCIQCLKCVKICPSGARDLIGKEMSVEEVMKEIRKDEIFYRQSRGGVTFSGGEPAYQPQFTTCILKDCKEERIHTAVETCGAVPWKQLVRLLKFTDLVLYDLKHANPDEHKRLTGKSNDLIIDNLRKIVTYKNKMNLEVIVRIPLIPGCNDSKENILSIVEVLNSLNEIKKVHLLPYHELGISKYEKLNRKYILKGTPRLTKNSLEEMKSLFTHKGLQTHTIE